MTPEAVNALVIVVVNAIGYAAVRRELVALRKAYAEHKTVTEDHEERITRLERRAA